ncbi:Acetolactate synthase large subunit [Candidatus Xiphinematobacter sp. Idaho Grape]|uniref:biosynthetic-type acetolactate synthase large subunit n=1 Tax=Candidatus Xiphinematobacter sp. Idaho Grape TaxID=1704307 RepID=UPI000705F71F|nr:biosynthetic-type acetolactate synthase large subunit [Candidatus Xiphinematobacter sp. Idaho Grape]ALJ56386.1 Acetolactate synthase large subunit [Candidatus Xiphinematobacter sp. Idaho Grape]
MNFCVSHDASNKSACKSPSPNGEANGAEILVDCLEKEGVEVIFAYPGGASMVIHQALTQSRKIRVVLPRHEQGGIFAAEGYARASGRVGVCMATSGPGATNLVTGIADAFMDSIPLVAITGQVPQSMIGRGAFQETDIVGMTLPVVKHSYLLCDIQDIPRVVKEAFYIAQSGRPGPVLIDIPKNIQTQRVSPKHPEEIHLRGYNPITQIEDQVLYRVIQLIEKAQCPMIYCGGGVVSSNASQELFEFVERTQIPVATTLMGIGCFPETHPLSLKWLGMHGTVYANNAVNEADLLLAIGVRFDDRVTGKFEEFCKHGTIVHVDIDRSEINKNRTVQVAVLSDLKYALSRTNHLLSQMGRSRITKGFDRFTQWYERIGAWKKQHPLAFKDTDDLIQPQYVIRLLDELTCGEVILTTGVGQHQMWAAQYYQFTHPRTFLTSAGLGAMGFGYPAAMGAKIACPDKQVIDIDGDGSVLMNIQELATAHIEGIAAKIIILNNQHLGMVVQWEDRFHSSNRAHTFLGDPRDPERIYPDYVTICKGFGVQAERVCHKRDLCAAIQRLLDSKEAYVLDVMVPYTEHVLPMIPAGMTYKDVLTE